ncbi:MAG TPA: sulfotransferase domain-containing protein [Terriglobales bacterium]|nr:sulfotransferase domain-containing protein [Terriglobales bacterium]
MSMGEMPVLFGNSFPKSGTHLLTQILSGFSRLGPVVESGLSPVLTFEAETGSPRPLTQILRELNRFLPGDIGYGHLHAFAEVVDLLCASGKASYFIYRDPRDIVVSHVFYVTDINNHHVHHDYYANELQDFEERLKVSILGRPELENPFPDILARFEPYLPWLSLSEVCSLRYEDLIHDLQHGLGAIFEHAVSRGFIYAGDKSTASAALSSAVRPDKSPTFRSGKTGGWRERFSRANKDLFKQVTGDLLVRLGYEQNQNW